MLLVERGGDGPGHWTQLLAVILVGVVCGGRSLGAGSNAVRGVEDKGWWLGVSGKAYRATTPHSHTLTTSLPVGGF